MPTGQNFELSDRRVVAVTGGDAGTFLQGLISNDMEKLASSAAIHAALLSPQGKILADFFIVPATDGFLLDVAASEAIALAKRLSMYKLRARAEIRDMSAALAVAIPEAPAAAGQGVVARYEDPRLAGLGVRLIVSRAEGAPCHDPEAVAAYHARRIGLGVPEGGKDFVLGDTFPHEALLDQLNGVSFSKGCYVGQEIVSRMEHRGTARKRVVPVNGDGPLTPGAEIKAGEVVLGTLGSVAGRRGLALLRLDRAREFMDKGVALEAAGTTVTIDIPAWARFSLADVKSEAQPT